MPPGANAYQTFAERVLVLKERVKKLPKTIPTAKKQDAIPTLFEKIPVPFDPSQHFEVFNRRMDILFGENLRDQETGRLPNVVRGANGLNMVVDYIHQAMESGNLVWDIAQIKVDRLIDEIQTILDLETKKSRQPSVSEEEDQDYVPPKRRRVDSDSEDGPIVVHVDSEGEEITEETELGEQLREKKSAAKRRKATSEARAQIKKKPPTKTSAKTQPKSKTRPQQSQKANKDELPELVSDDDDSGDESDGNEALRKVEEADNSHGKRRGPANKALKYFHDAVPVADSSGEKRWEFKCRLCGSKQRVRRTIGDNSGLTFDDEPKLPKLNNISAHAKACQEKHADDEDLKSEDETKPTFNLERSRQMMEAYLKDGELNPAIIADQAGFFRIFSAWIFDESLPWTTGESGTLAMLFNYLKVKFQLPSDKTVRNYLGIIFAELHGMVVREFAEADQDEANEEREAKETSKSTRDPIDKELEELKKMMAEDQAVVEADEIAEISGSTSALRFIVTKIVSSPQRRLQFRKIARRKYSGNPATEHLVRLMVVRDIRTRWNYTHAMIRRALLMKDAIDDWVYESNTFRGAGLAPADWKLLDEIAKFLDPFTQATAQMSRASIPTIPLVLPLYEKLYIHLHLASKSVTNNRSVRKGAAWGLEKLVKYKRKAQENQYYCLGTMLHPYLRSQWFRTTAPSNDVKAQQEAVDKAETLFYHVAETYFKEANTNPVNDTPPSNDSTNPDNNQSAGTKSVGEEWLEDLIKFDIPDIPQIARNPKELFDEEVRRYLAFDKGRGDLKSNPLTWWKANAGAFPVISRMARDFLAIPATSVSVERTFSKSRHICSDLRSSLKEETVKQALLSKVWIKDGLFKMVAPVRKRKKHGSE